jgi:hypothetical protein
MWRQPIVIGATAKRSSHQIPSSSGLPCRLRSSQRHACAFSRREAPERCTTRPPQKTEAQGMPGAWPHPQPCVRKVKAHNHSHHRLAEHFRHSLRDGFTVSSALSLVIGLSCHHHQRGVSGPLGPTSPSRRFDSGVEESGPHGFAVRGACFRQAHAPRPSHPALHVRDDA